MVRVGERTGQLGAMMGHVASHALEQNRRQRKRLVALSEPAAIVVLAVSFALVIVGSCWPTSLSGRQVLRTWFRPGFHRLRDAAHRHPGAAFTLLEMAGGIGSSSAWSPAWSGRGCSRRSTRARCRPRRADQAAAWRGRDAGMDVGIYAGRRPAWRCWSTPPADPALRSRLEGSRTSTKRCRSIPGANRISMRFRVPRGGPFSIISFGADGKAGGEGNDANRPAQHDGRRAALSMPRPCSGHPPLERKRVSR